WQRSNQSVSIRFLKKNHVYVDIGSYLSHAQYCFGTGFKRNSSMMNFSASWRQYTGLQFSCSIQYVIERGNP
ncbi:MAG: hypothetical protein ACOVP1_01825, partial [Bacteroidia bacterium]